MRPVTPSQALSEAIKVLQHVQRDAGLTAGLVQKKGVPEKYFGDLIDAVFYLKDAILNVDKAQKAIAKAEKMVDKLERR